jgi:hypothetical protein
MNTQPTAAERQRMAFDLLASRARAAHAQGDGLQVCNLVETAAQELAQLLKEKTFELSVRDVQWIVIFRLFWLLTRWSCDQTERLLNELHPVSADDAAVLNALKCYHFLVAQPLSGAKQAVDHMGSVDLTQFTSDSKIEVRELARHLLELSWCRLGAEAEWSNLVEKWSKGGPEWLSKESAAVRKRLVAQRRLTTPSVDHPPYAEKNLSELRDLHPLAELWALHLMGNRDHLHRRLTTFDQRSSHPTEWRTISDYWHTNDGSRGAAQSEQSVVLEQSNDDNFALSPIQHRQVHQPRIAADQSGPPSDPDSPDIWLSRRRFLSAESPFFRFCDYREGRIDEGCHELFRKNIEGNAHLRFEIWQLAILHEIMALRLWDFGLWRVSVKAQAETMLEACRWESEAQASGWQISWFLSVCRLLARTGLLRKP